MSYHAISYQSISYLYHIILVSKHLILYHMISCHIISYDSCDLDVNVLPPLRHENQSPGFTSPGPERVRENGRYLWRCRSGLPGFRGNPIVDYTIQLYREYTVIIIIRSFLGQKVFVVFVAVENLLNAFWGTLFLKWSGMGWWGFWEEPFLILKGPGQCWVEIMTRSADGYWYDVLQSQVICKEII